MPAWCSVQNCHYCKIEPPCKTDCSCKSDSMQKWRFVQKWLRAKMTIHEKLTPCKIDDSCKTECSCKNDNSIVLLYYSKTELSRSFFSFSSKLKAVKHEGLFKNFYYINNLSNLNLNKPFLNAQQLILTYFLYFFQCLNVFKTLNFLVVKLVFKH